MSARAALKPPKIPFKPYSDYGIYIFKQRKERACWTKFFCFGGCFVNSYFTNGDLKKPDGLTCAMRKKRIECAIMVKVMRQLDLL
jgi:uncharacterized protein